MLNKLTACLQLPFPLSAPHFVKSLSVFGLDFGLSEGGPLPSGVGGVSSKAAAPISSPALRSLHGRPDRSGSLTSTDLQSLSLSLSRPHLANDEAHALRHDMADIAADIAKPARRSRVRH